jgi:RNA polymerase-binding transcription factor DksA
MAGFVHTDVQQSLLWELNLVMRHYFHQNIDEIMNELHCQSKCVENTTKPDVILKTIHHSGILYQRSDKIISQLRNAVARYANGTYGWCSQCGGEIPSTQLLHTPTSYLCPDCIQNRFASVYMRDNVH